MALIIAIAALRWVTLPCNASILNFLYVTVLRLYRSNNVSFDKSKHTQILTDTNVHELVFLVARHNDQSGWQYNCQTNNKLNWILSTNNIITIINTHCLQLFYHNGYAFSHFCFCTFALGVSFAKVSVKHFAFYCLKGG